MRISSMDVSSLDKCVCVNDFATLARERLPSNHAVFLESGATDEQTLEENCSAFKKYRFQPRCLIDVSNVSLKCSILGQDLNFPIAVAPTGQMKLFSPNGELDAAVAAESLGTVFTESIWSSVAIEDIAKVTPNGCNWFQLYILKNRELNRHLVERAEKSGARAIVLTVDCPVRGIRYRVMKSKPMKLIPANTKDGEVGWMSLTSNFKDSGTTWKDLEWLQSITNLPIILKGIMTPEDAITAVDHGAAAIWVSNHGGRQFDGVLPSIYALPLIARAVKGRCPIFVDGGIRNGGDVAKAIALGADCVFIGRPIVWGIACGEAAGAKKVLKILRDELELTMKLLGVTSVQELQSNPNLVVHESKIISKL